MKNEVFGEVSFDTGWETNAEITLWGKKYTIKVNASAYYEHEVITTEQEKAYIAFKKITAEKIEKLLKQFYEDLDFKEFYQEREEPIKTTPSEFLIPTVLEIEQDGVCALLFDDENDPDNGMAVQLFPEEKVMTQDEFLRNCLVYIIYS